MKSRDAAAKTRDDQESAQEVGAAYNRHREIITSLKDLLSRYDAVKSLEQLADRFDKSAAGQLELYLQTSQVIRNARERQKAWLTPQQVTRLTALRDAMKTTHDAAQTEMRTNMEAMTAAMKGATADTNQLKQHFQAMHAAMGRAHWAMLSATVSGTRKVSSRMPSRFSALRVAGEL